MILLSLTAGLRWLVLPLYLEPRLEEEIESLSLQISRHLRQSATISYQDVALSIDWSGIYLKVIGPNLAVGKGDESNSLSADSAGIVLDYRDIVPDLFVSGTVLSLTMDEHGNITLADFATTSDEMLDVTGLLQIGSELPPFRLVLHDTKLVLSRPGREQLAFEGIDISAFPNLDNQTYVLAMHSNDLYLRANLAFDERNQPDINWYLNSQTESFNFIMDILGWPAQATSANIQAWGSVSEDNEHRLIVTGEGYGLALGEQDYRSRIRHASIEAEATISLQNEQAAGLWKLRSRDLEAQVPEHILGTKLALEKAAAGGNFRIEGDNWRGEFTDLRAIAPGSALAGQMIMAGGEQGLTMSLAAYAPSVNFPVAAQLLPDDLGDAVLTLLREDLQATSALVNTLVIAGDPQDFPWHDDASGKFLLQIGFASATLNYLEGYPPVADASGRVEIDGARLNVAVDNARIAGAPTSRALAVIDDMQVIPGTLYIAGNIDFAERQLDELLKTLPATATQLQDYPQLLLSGRQQTVLRLAIPLDTDDPIAIDGRLDLIDTQLAWDDFPAKLEKLRGNLRYSAAGVTGIARASLWDTPVRVSLNIGDSGSRFEMAGAFDIGDTLARMEIDSSLLPMAGTSAWKLAYDGQDLALTSNLRGTRVDLPIPLAKPAEESTNLRIEIGEEELAINYANGLLRGQISGGDTAIAIGAAALPAAGASPAVRVAARVAEADLDALVSWLGELPGGGTAPVAVTLRAASAQLFGQPHRDVVARITADATVTVIAIESDGTAAQLNRIGATVTVSIARLNSAPGNQQQETADAIPAPLATVTVGSPTGSLPPLVMHGTSITIGAIRLPTVRLAGRPQDERWLLEKFEIDVAPGSTVFISGQSAMHGEPDSQITLTVPQANMQQLFDHLGFEDEVSDGQITVGGTLHWRGALYKPHYQSLAGTIAFAASDFRMNQLEGGGAKVTRLFSPFTLLTLGFLELGEQGINFDDASGKIEFVDGRAHFRDLRLDGDDISLIISGSTNLVDETYDVKARAIVHNSNEIFTAGASLFNPLFAGILFFFDNIAGKPIIKPMEVGYSITGPWDDPQIVNDDEPAATEPATTPKEAEPAPSAS